jgi:hypothetical protein
MSEQRDEAAKTELDELLEAYALAAVEFNLAAVPLILPPLKTRVRPTAAEITREATARAALVDARRKVWVYARPDYV